MSDLSFIYGIHSVHALLKRAASTVNTLFIMQTKHNAGIKRLMALAERQHVSVQIVSKSELDQMVPNGVHQGVVARCQTKAQGSHNFDEILEYAHDNALFLVLDGVQDPHNLGAILRVADAAGVSAVIAPKDRAVGLTPVVHKVASGAASTVPYFQVTNLAQTMRKMQEAGVWIYGASEHGDDSIYDLQLTGKVALVMGAEGAGLRRLTSEVCDHLMHIPMLGSVDSLNVSVATGVCLYEVVRQRRG